MASADYSQIELRFLAHLSDDLSLIEVFHSGGDIHTQTAAAIFNKTPSEIEAGERRAAKAINFGIVYGMGPFRLAQEIGVSNREAKAFIEAYFARYPGIKDYMEDTLAFAREMGYVETLFGRRREIPDILAKNHMVRTAAERVSINSRIQGSAADLIKIAMIDIHRFLQDKKSRMIIQVHDELVFEIHEDEQDILKEIQSRMEQAAKLKVPLVADAALGQSWGEAH